MRFHYPIPEFTTHSYLIVYLHFIVATKISVLLFRVTGEDKAFEAENSTGQLELSARISTPDQRGTLWQDHEWDDSA